MNSIYNYQCASNLHKRVIGTNGRNLNSLYNVGFTKHVIGTVRRNLSRPFRAWARGRACFSYPELSYTNNRRGFQRQCENKETMTFIFTI